MARPRKRISFNHYYATHLFTLVLDCRERTCVECDYLTERLKNFLNDKELEKEMKKLKLL